MPDEVAQLSAHFNTNQEVISNVFAAERIDISEAVFKELAPVMNEMHGVNHSFRFWKMVMSDYVNAVVSIKNILDHQQMNDKPLIFAINGHRLPTAKQKIIARLPSIIKHYKAPGTFKQIHHILAENDNISIGFHPGKLVQTEIGYPLPVYYPVYAGSGDLSKRAIVNRLEKKAIGIFSKNIIRRLPKVYVEYFEKDYNSIQLIDPAKKTFHLHGMPPYFNSLLVAKYAEHGAKLVCYQHGAYYGELVGHNSYLHENSLADEYRTWGWKIKSNDVPSKAYRLETFRQQYDAVAKTNEFDFLMCFPGVFDANIEFYKKATAYFLQHISTGKYKNLLARPRPSGRFFSQSSVLSFINDSRVTINSGRGYMAEVMCKCRLVIQFSVPATNFMECLYVDHPTMGLLDNDQPTAIVKPYYDFLLQQGVLHKDFVSLVKHLNSIDLDTWWNALLKEPMYQQFKNEFLRKV